MSAAACAVCGGADLFGTGICTSCADDGGARALLFLSPVDALDRTSMAKRLRSLAGGRARAADLGEVLRGRQPLARLPGTIARAAVGALAAQGISARALDTDRWHRALPADFVLMVLCVLLSGTAIGLRGIPFFLFAAPAVALLLVWGASLQLRRPLIGVPRSAALLPAEVRGALAASLARIPAGPLHQLVLDLARVGEATYASLPHPFRTSALGESVLALVGEVGPLGLETARLQAIRRTRSTRSGRDDGELQSACDQRVRLLEQTLEVMTRIARHGAESDEAAAAEASALLGEVRAAAAHRVEAEAEVDALLGGSGGAGLGESA